MVAESDTGKCESSGVAKMLLRDLVSVKTYKRRKQQHDLN